MILFIFSKVSITVYFPYKEAKESFFYHTIMAGVGGIFPSYEDFELDKKKISEHFSGNFHEILYPLNYTSKHGPFQFHCPPDFKNFIWRDLNSK